jgi:MFS family permease
LVTDRLGTKLTIIIGSIMNSVSVLFLPPVSPLPHRLEMIILGLVLFGIPTAFINIPGVIDMIKTLKDKGYDEDFANTIASGVYTLAYAFGEVIGPVFGGYITERIGFPSSCVYTCLTNLCYAVVFSVLTYKYVFSHFINMRDRNKDGILLERIEIIREKIKNNNF